jgi:hypothetical protein
VDEQRAEQDGAQEQGNPSRLDAEDQGRAAQRLGGEGGVGKPAGQPLASKKAAVPGSVKVRSLRTTLWARNIVPSDTRSRVTPARLAHASET